MKLKYKAINYLKQYIVQIQSNKFTSREKCRQWKIDILTGK